MSCRFTVTNPARAHDHPDADQRRPLDRPAPRKAAADRRFERAEAAKVVSIARAGREGRGRQRTPRVRAPVPDEPAPSNSHANRLAGTEWHGSHGMKRRFRVLVAVADLRAVPPGSSNAMRARARCSISSSRRPPRDSRRSGVSRTWSSSRASRARFSASRSKRSRKSRRDRSPFVSERAGAAPGWSDAREILLVTISGRMITGVAVVPSTPRS